MSNNTGVACKKCGADEVLPRRRVCRKCWNAYKREWNARNKEKSRRWASDYYNRNKRRVLDRMFIRYWSDPDFRRRCRESCRQRRLRVPQKRKKSVKLCGLVDDITPSAESFDSLIDIRLSLPHEYRPVLDFLIENNFDVDAACESHGKQCVDGAMAAMRQLYQENN